GVFRYDDVNNDGVISPDDRIHLGNPNPDFSCGLTLSVDYKNFNLSTNIYGVYGNEIFNSIKVYTYFLQTSTEVKNRNLLNAFSEQNKNSNIPKIQTSSTFSTNTVPNSF